MLKACRRQNHYLTLPGKSKYQTYCMYPGDNLYFFTITKQKVTSYNSHNNNVLPFTTSAAIYALFSLNNNSQLQALCCLAKK